jgi:anthranilate phosphoribosyltransferase
VVHGAGGLDEISLAGETLVAEIKGGGVERFTVTPEDFGVSRAPIDSVRGGTALENAATIRDILVDRGGPPRDIVIANAAAALVAGNVATNFLEGTRLASAALTSGAAKEKLAALVDFTQRPW